MREAQAVVAVPRKATKRCAACGGEGGYRISVLSREGREVAGFRVWACAAHAGALKNGVDEAFLGSAYRVLVRLPRPTRRLRA